MDLANITAAPSVIAVGDREYKIGPFRYMEMGIIQRWLNEHRKPAPKIGKDTNWPMVLFSDLDGVEMFLAVLFGKHQELAEDDMVHILKHLGRKELDVLFGVAMEVEDEDVEEDTGPKSPAPAAKPTTGGSSDSSSGKRAGRRRSSRG